MHVSRVRATRSAHAQIFGTNGNPLVTPVSTGDSRGTHTDMCGVSPGVNYMNRYERAFAAATQHFVRLVAGSEQTIVTREQVLLGAQITHAATESARTGEAVRM